MIRFGVVLALVLAALGLLAGGVFTSSLLLVYLAIGVAAVAAVVLTIGAVIWRAEIFGVTAEVRHPELAAAQSAWTAEPGTANELGPAGEPGLAAAAVKAAPAVEPAPAAKPAPAPVRPCSQASPRPRVRPRSQASPGGQGSTGRGTGPRSQASPRGQGSTGRRD